MATTSTPLIILVVAVLLFVALGGICVAIFTVGKRDDSKYDLHMQSVDKVMDKQNELISVMSEMVLRNEKRSNDVSEAIRECNQQVKEQMEKLATQHDRGISIEEIIEFERKLNEYRAEEQAQKIEESNDDSDEIEEISLDDFDFDEGDLVDVDDFSALDEAVNVSEPRPSSAVQQGVNTMPQVELQTSSNEPERTSLYYETQLFGIPDPHAQDEFNVGRSGKKYTTSELENLIRE